MYADAIPADQPLRWHYSRWKAEPVAHLTVASFLRRMRQATTPPPHELHDAVVDHARQALPRHRT